MKECQSLNEIVRRLILQIADNGAQVLLSSSIGSEGRNFQFACHLVLFDLPENPDLLEQCIGRLDRIGQTRDVQIYVPLPSRFCTARFSTLVS